MLRLDADGPAGARRQPGHPRAGRSGRARPRRPHRPRVCHLHSGSTGRPKGVMVEHRAAVNRVEWMQNEYALTPDDVVLQKTPFSFDVSVWEFVWPLITGAPWSSPRRAATRTPPTWCRSSGPPRSPPRLRAAHAAAHARPRRLGPLHLAAPGLLQRRGPAARAARAPLRPAPRAPAQPVRPDRGRHRRHPLGLPARHDDAHRADPARPIQNIQLHVLDDLGRRRAVGCAGRAAHRGRRPGPRLSEQPEPDARALRCRTRSPAGPGRPHVPHGRPRPVAARRHPGVPRPHRQPGQAARLPHRTRRDRGPPLPATPPCATAPSSPARTAPAARDSWATSSSTRITSKTRPASGRGRTRGEGEPAASTTPWCVTWGSRCPSTWSRAPWSVSTPCR